MLAPTLRFFAPLRMTRALRVNGSAAQERDEWHASSRTYRTHKTAAVRGPWHTVSAPLRFRHSERSEESFPGLLWRPPLLPANEQRRHSRAGGNPLPPASPRRAPKVGLRCLATSHSEAPLPCSVFWIPACAGMTVFPTRATRYNGRGTSFRFRSAVVPGNGLGLCRHRDPSLPAIPPAGTVVE
ncbi:MAG: hypothetical protein BWY06_00173 [Candidatus Latescibacteria bacterium ADurb.Bin168]|nr:MAG: hypothetical protein BWY06_00173 [Candidatus Latescibacteria bacterium ADurb.Bin168]